jgi:hypothetical protein
MALLNYCDGKVEAGKDNIDYFGAVALIHHIRQRFSD